MRKFIKKPVLSASSTAKKAIVSKVTNYIYNAIEDEFLDNIGGVYRVNDDAKTLKVYSTLESIEGIIASIVEASGLDLSFMNDIIDFSNILCTL